jgi:hypothetical protein
MFIAQCGGGRNVIMGGRLGEKGREKREEGTGKDTGAA